MAKSWNQNKTVINFNNKIYREIEDKLVTRCTATPLWIKIKKKATLRSENVK